MSNALSVALRTHRVSGSNLDRGPTSGPEMSARGFTFGEGLRRRCPSEGKVVCSNHAWRCALIPKAMTSRCIEAVMSIPDATQHSTSDVWAAGEAYEPYVGR